MIDLVELAIPLDDRPLEQSPRANQFWGPLQTSSLQLGAVQGTKYAPCSCPSLVMYIGTWPGLRQQFITLHTEASYLQDCGLLGVTAMAFTC